MSVKLFYEKAFFKVVGFGIIDFDYIALHIVKGLAVADDLFRLYAPAHLVVAEYKVRFFIKLTGTEHNMVLSG